MKHLTQNGMAAGTTVKDPACVVPFCPVYSRLLRVMDVSGVGIGELPSRLTGEGRTRKCQRADGRAEAA